MTESGRGETRLGVRDRILDAAMAVLREGGIQQLTQMEVARRAGVRQSHLTYYFPTREHLLDAVIARGVQGIAAGLHHAVDEPDGGVDALLRRFAAGVVDLEHMRLFVSMIVGADGDEDLRAVMADTTRRMEAALAEALGGADATERARRTLAALWGLGLYQFLVRPPEESSPAPAYLSWVAEMAARDA